MTWLLLPFSWVYALVLAGRNWLYDQGYYKSEAGFVPLINVGNLRVGGTGKTPHVAWLVGELLRQGQRPAILSRGYGRRSRGPRLAGPADSAATVGDEPWQYFEQFGAQNVPVAVAESRRHGLRLLRVHQPEITVIVLDDAYQHRAVRPNLNLLLTELARPFYLDYVLPAGRLRESRAGARRADAVIITKCPPDLPAAAQAAIAAHVRRFTRSTQVPVLFSSYDYGPPTPLLPAEAAAPTVPTDSPAAPGNIALLLSGIAQPGPLRQHVEKQGYTLTFQARFPDHHLFTPADLARVRRHWQPGQPIFTTEKDATRLRRPELAGALTGLPVYTIPVQVALLADGAATLRRELSALFPAAISH
ncbi:tetraacyldisaccharide 4'-kinase [uncultured Hymenobacter sp.]|uniref:tetraacyldisaccharide 4'-kinase n=1 Tax=uncultured Hymenobacter sp. TaxID=170016 RepID=UPI0035CA0B6A